MNDQAMGRGPYREATRPVRIPLSLLPDVLALLAQHRARREPTESTPATVREGKPHGRLPPRLIFNQPPEGARCVSVG